jgi:hypothetical protein
MIAKKEIYVAAIDPLALLLPNDVYVAINKPRPPEYAKLTQAQRRFMHERIDELKATLETVEKELAKTEMVHA